MRNIIYAALALALVCLSTSCEKQETISPILDLYKNDIFMKYIETKLELYSRIESNLDIIPYEIGSTEDLNKFADILGYDTLVEFTEILVSLHSQLQYLESNFNISKIPEDELSVIIVNKIVNVKKKNQKGWSCSTKNTICTVDVIAASVTAAVGCTALTGGVVIGICISGALTAEAAGVAMCYSNMQDCSEAAAQQ